METRDKVLIFALLAGGSYAAYVNWDMISERLGLNDLTPGRVRAIELAKTDLSLSRSRPNWLMIKERGDRGEITLGEGCWDAQPVTEEDYKVLCNYSEAGVARCYEFRVNVASGRVEYLGDNPAAPVKPATPR